MFSKMGKGKASFEEKNDTLTEKQQNNEKSMHILLFISNITIYLCLDPDTSVRLQEGGGAHKALVTGSVKYFWSIEIVSVKNRVTW